MNVELVNPLSVFHLFARHDATQHGWRPPAWASRLSARLGEEIRYRRALNELHRLDDRDLDDLDLARADLPALAWRHAKGLAPLSRSWR
jgi:uncharacterized protein YjiS (DUF1127 family)